MTTIQDDIARELMGLGITPGGLSQPGGQRTVSPPDLESPRVSRIEGRTGLDMGVGLDFGFGFNLAEFQMPGQSRGQRFDFQYDLGQRQMQRQVTRFSDPFINETMIQIPNVPRIPIPYDLGFNLTTGSGSSRTRRKDKDYEVRDVLEVALGESARSVIGFGIDDYTAGLIEDYGSYFGYGSRRKR